jgi:hypothetical protein
MGDWDVITSESYDVWFDGQDEGDQAVIQAKVILLGAAGPNLGRPHADTLKGSKKLANLKELRPKTHAHVFRIAYIFDPERNGLLRIGGDKKGKNEKKFYNDLIIQAEQIYMAYLEKKAEEKEKQDGISPHK